MIGAAGRGFQRVRLVVLSEVFGPFGARTEARTRDAISAPGEAVA